MALLFGDLTLIDIIKRTLRVHNCMPWENIYENLLIISIDELAVFVCFQKFTSAILNRC